MTTISQNVDLNAPPNSFDGWETCAASAFNVVVYTGNWFAAYSEDSGATFQSMSPNGLCMRHGQSLCCDQVIIYVPRINSFCWILQTNQGNYVLAVASPQDISEFKGKQWTTYLIPADRFGIAGAKMDYPELSYGDNFLYLTFNLAGNYSIALRLSLAE